MIALCIALAALSLVAVGGLIYFAKAALDARALATNALQQVGEIEVKDANAATQAVAKQEQAQERRGDELEKEVTDAPPHDAAGALGRLSKLSDAEALPAAAGSDRPR